MMGKRSNFERIPRDFYPTPYEAVLPLIPHLRKGVLYHEPCAGDGALIEHLDKHDVFCDYAWDIKPTWPIQRRGDSTTIKVNMNRASCFITNPPWDRKILHPIIENLCHQAPTWLLFDADWMHTKQSAPYMKWCRKIVSIGRLKWIPGSKMTGKDNCCWYLFDGSRIGHTSFIGRTE